MLNVLLKRRRDLLDWKEKNVVFVIGIKKVV